MISDATAPSMRLRRALASLAALRSCVPPMATRADTHADDVADALREYEGDLVARDVTIATLRRSL